MIRVSNPRSAVLAVLALVSLLPRAASAQCRDASGEPSACAETPPPAAPAPPSAPPTVYEREGGFVEWGLVWEVLDLRPLHLSPERPGWVPEVARGLVLTGDLIPRDRLAGGLSVVFGARPTSFLRFPEVRLMMAGGEMDPGELAPVQGSLLSARIHNFFVLRAEVGAALEAHVGPVGFHASGRLGIAGYFAEAEVAHADFGDLGRMMLAEDALEVGWELGVSFDLEPGLAITGTFHGVHLGAEGFGSSFRVVGTFCP